jgi:hypothetical protein
VLSSPDDEELLSLSMGNCTDWTTFQALGPVDGSAGGELADGCA